MTLDGITRRTVALETLDGERESEKLVSALQQQYELESPIRSKNFVLRPGSCTREGKVREAFFSIGPEI